MHFLAEKFCGVIKMKRKKKGIPGILCVQHEGDVFCEYTKRYLGVILRVPFIVEYDLIYLIAEVYGFQDRSCFSKFLEMLDKSPDIMFYEELERNKHSGTVLIGKKSYGILKALYKTKSVLRGSFIIKGGVEYFPVIVFGNPKKLEEKVREYVSRRAIAYFKVNMDINIEKLSAAAPIVSKLREELTHSEIRVLLAAYELGYFRWPRIHSSEDVAKYLGISKSTFLEHLRKGEEKIVRLLHELLKT